MLRIISESSPKWWTTMVISHGIESVKNHPTKTNPSDLWWILGTTSWRKWYLVTILINVRLQEVINPRKLVEKNPLTRVKSPNLLNIVTKYHFHYHVLSHTPICILSNKCGHSSRTTGLRFLIQMIKPKERRILPFLNRHCHLCQISWRALACLLDPRAEGWSGKKKNRRGPKENKKTCCSWFRGLWRYFRGLSNLKKTCVGYYLLAQKLKTSFVERQKEPNPTTEKTRKKMARATELIGSIAEAWKWMVDIFSTAQKWRRNQTESLPHYFQCFLHG